MAAERKEKRKGKEGKDGKDKENKEEEDTQPLIYFRKSVIYLNQNC